MMKTKTAFEKGMTKFIPPRSYLMIIGKTVPKEPKDWFEMSFTVHRGPWLQLDPYDHIFQELHSAKNEL